MFYCLSFHVTQPCPGEYRWQDSGTSSVLSQQSIRALSLPLRFCVYANRILANEWDAKSFSPLSADGSSLFSCYSVGDSPEARTSVSGTAQGDLSLKLVAVFI